LCFILARGGSKGVPKKNLLLISGKPLIAHSIDIAKKVKYIDKIYVSSEDKEIKTVSLKFGADVINRPPELATDTADYLDAVKHMIDTISDCKENPIIVLLETTSPIRKVSDIEKCIEMYNENVDSVISVNQVKSDPSYMYKQENNRLKSFMEKAPVKRRQDAEQLVAYNGSILVSSCNFIKNQKDVVLGGRMIGYVLDEKYSIDIDSKLDFEICRFIMESLDK
ncbi:MAG TPA: acylneuraminate cytidylyltransferase family protein, partial [Nitrosopumilaceae archaeon]|nr:acylneuraminate cytidylyltransferase family protein [Nitrosopumilaceae archaeon]